MRRGLVSLTGSCASFLLGPERKEHFHRCSYYAKHILFERWFSWVWCWEKHFGNLKHLKTVICLLNMQAFSCLAARVTPFNFRLPLGHRGALLYVLQSIMLSECPFNVTRRVGGSLTLALSQHRPGVHLGQWGVGSFWWSLRRGASLGALLSAKHMGTYALIWCKAWCEIRI